LAGMLPIGVRSPVEAAIENNAKLSWPRFATYNQRPSGLTLISEQ